MSAYRWQIMDEWVDYWERANPHAPFAAKDVANSIGIPRHEATSLIQAYLHEQWRPESRTHFVIKRQGRTRNALWIAGVRKTDVRLTNTMFYEDMVVKAERAFVPTLNRIKALDPKRGAEIERTLDGTLKGAFQVMKAALNI